VPATHVEPLPGVPFTSSSDTAATGSDGKPWVAFDGTDSQAELRPGDRVAVEDPGWPLIGDLVSAIGLRAEPVAVDSGGPVPDRLAAALRAGARAVIATPRGQNPTGAVIGARRAAQLQDVLAGNPHVLVIEDDYIAGIAGAPYAAVHGRSDRWTAVRSVSKVLGPDLRLTTAPAGKAEPG
jgi:DNA-binding transcriptional MocR family regulator